MPENQTDTRGIQNAQVRHAKRAEDRLTSSRIYDKTVGRHHQKKGPNHSNRQTRTDRQSFENTQAKTLATALKGISNELDTQYNESDAQLLIKEKPVEPNFPFIMLSIAILKDILDAADLSVIGVIVTTPITFVIAIVLFIWILGKLSGGWWKKGMIRWLWTRYILAMAIEFTPFGKMIPATTILILMAHYREKKIVILLNGALEQLRKAGVGR